jgi:hypothetical protein
MLYVLIRHIICEYCISVFCVRLKHNFIDVHKVIKKKRSLLEKWAPVLEKPITSKRVAANTAVLIEPETKLNMGMFTNEAQTTVNT